MMKPPKPGMPLLKQNQGHGPSARPARPMLPASPAGRVMMASPSGKGGGTPITHPTTPLSTKSRVMISSPSGAGSKNKGTFKAPRGGEGGSPTEKGYHKV